eukprot:gene6551-6779_t
MSSYPGPPSTPPLELDKQDQLADDGPEADDDEDVDIPPAEAREHPPADEDTTSIMAIIPNDHDRIKRNVLVLLPSSVRYRYKDPTDSPHLRELLVLQLLRELTVHSQAEEAVLYPVIADKVNEHMRDHALDEHESLALFSSDLEGMKVDEEGYDEKMHQLMETFLEHVHDVEHIMMPALRNVMEEKELRELGKRFEAAKQHVPTRPHVDAQHKVHVDDATVLLDAARDAAQFGGTPPAIGSPSTEVLREAQAAE